MLLMSRLSPRWGHVPGLFTQVRGHLSVVLILQDSTVSCKAKGDRKSNSLGDNRATATKLIQHEIFENLSDIEVRGTNIWEKLDFNGVAWPTHT